MQLPVLTDYDLLAMERRHCAASLGNFAKRAWHVLEPATPIKWGWSLDATCDHLEAVARGDIHRLLINVPPGSMKSLLVGVLLPAWEWGPKGKPAMRYLGTAHKQDLAVRDSTKCRRLIQSVWYQKLWPIELTGDQNAKTKFENSATGFREAMAFGSMTGSRGDCLLGETVVYTDIGRLTIKDIVESSASCYVLSYEKHTDKLVYRPIQAVARRSSPHFYRVHTSGGVVVECTGDHRFYTARGYVEARILSSDDILLRVLREGCEAQCLHDEEAREKRSQGDNVQSKVHANSNKHKTREERTKLQNLRGEDSKISRMVLRRGLQKGIRKSNSKVEGRKKEEFPSDLLPNMQRSNSSKNKKINSKILQCCVQERRSFKSNARGKQSWLAKWDERETARKPFFTSIQKNEDGYTRERRSKMRCLRIPKGFVRSSHRHGPIEQRLEKPSYSVQSVPCDTSRQGSFGIERDTVAMVERVCEPATVYDIQVEGTRCFFANGVLVHNCVIIDDPHSVDDANSRVRLANDVMTFREALPSRVNNDDSAIIIIMQRLAVGDVSDVALELGYEHLLIPMRYETGRSKWVVGKGDPRKDDGELMFPERFSEASVTALELSLGSHAAAGQLQQRPNPRGGRIIKTEWFKMHEQPPVISHRVIYGDTAMKTAERNDYSVFECWGIGKEDGNIYLLDLIRGKWEAPELERMAVAFWEKHKAADAGKFGQLRQMKIEDKASGTGLIQGLKLKAGIPVSGIQRTKDKYTRLLDVVGYIEAGRVSLPQGAPFVSDFLSECESFSADDTHAHDDQIDPMIDAINDMLAGGNTAQLWERII